LSIEDFLKKDPDDNTIVLFDEIDQMIGESSFNIMETPTHVKAFYYPELMKKWKAIIGFSGTISDFI
jgi:hypothetical protein